MLRVRPFAALRPRPELAAQVAAVPYDVVNRAEARALCCDNELSLLHVSRPEVDLPDEVDAHDERVYAAARQAFARLVERGVLVRESRPSLYAYRQQASLGGRRVSQLGIVGCCHVDDYNEERIKKHEVTRKDKEDDRTRHTLSINANSGPVFLAYRPRPELDELALAATRGSALYDFTAEDGVRHTVWRIEDAQPYVAAFAAVECAYVADGHHRTASAARAAAERRRANPRHTGDEEYNWFLSVLFPADQLNVLPYHRLVRDLGGLTAGRFLERLGAVADLSPAQTPIPSAPHAFGVYLEGRWHQARVRDALIPAADPVRSLDYVLLSEQVLGPILGITDLRTDPRIDFVGGIRGTGELERRVDSGEHAAGFAMRATTLPQLMAVADAGLIMPPKSTWFEPKLRSGLLIHTLD